MKKRYCNTLKIMLLISLGMPGMACIAQNQDKGTVFWNVNLIPMTKDTVIANQTVVIVGGKIEKIVNTSVVDIDPDMQIIDGTGKYLMPGLAEMHAHYYSDYNRTSLFNLFLKNGVTTVRFFQSEPNDTILAWSKGIKDHQIWGPNLFTCGLFFHKAENYQLLQASSIVTTPKDYDFIKLYGSLTKKEFISIMRIARSQHAYTAGHVPFLVGLNVFLKQKVNEVAHVNELDWELVHYPKLNVLRDYMFAIVLNNWIKDFYSFENLDVYLKKKERKLDLIVRNVKQSEAWVNTTMVGDKILYEQLFLKEKFLKRPELPYMIDRFMPEYLAGKNTYERTIKKLMQKNQKRVGGDNGSRFLQAYVKVNQVLTKKLSDNGVPLLLGTDCPIGSIAVVPGYSLLEELECLTDCGISPYEAIKSGTANAGFAEMKMRGSNTIGTLEVGKQADCILTDGNPLENVAHIKKMQGVMVQGRWLSREELNALPVAVKPTLADVLAKVIETNDGISRAHKRYLEIKADSLEYYAIHAEYLNELGYKLLRANKTNESIEIFSILVAEFPESEWFDSLGEAYLKNGNKQAAIDNYQMSVNLNPKNKNGMKALRKLLLSKPVKY